MADLDKEATRAALRKLGQPDVLDDEPLGSVASLEGAPAYTPPALGYEPGYSAGTPEPKPAGPPPAPTPSPSYREGLVSAPVREADPLSKNFESDLAASEGVSEAVGDPALRRAAVAADPSTDPSLATAAPGAAERPAQAPAPAAKPTPAPSPETDAGLQPAAGTAPQQGVTVVVQQPQAAKPAARPATRPQAAQAAPVAEPRPGETPTDAQLLAAGGRGANAPAPVVDENHDGIEDKAINLNQSARQLRTESQMGVERQRELMGEDVDIHRDLLARERGIEAGRAAEGAQRLTDIEDRTEGYRRRFEETRAQYQAELADLKERMGRPPSGAIAAIMGIAATIAAAKDKGQLANALQGVGQTLTQNALQRWQAGIQAGQGQLEGMGKLVNLDHLANSDEKTQYEALYKAKDAEIQAAFDAARREAKTGHEIQALDMAENAYAKQSKDAQLALLKKQEEARLKALAIHEMQVANASGDPAKIAAARIRWGERGEAARQLGTKTDQGLLNLDKTEAGMAGERARAAFMQAKADALAGKGRAGGGGIELTPGWTFPEHLSKGPAMTDLVKKVQAKADIQYSLERLQDIAKQIENGTLSRTGTPKDWATAMDEVKRHRTSMVGKLSQVWGTGNPTGKEFDTVLETINDPSDIVRLTKASQLFMGASRNLEDAQARQFRSIGALPNADWEKKYSGVAAPAPAGESGFVDVRDAKGNVVSVSPAEAEAGMRLEKQRPGSGYVGYADDTEE